MSFLFACQTITFGPDHGERLADVIAEVKKAGYDGVETGLHHLQKNKVSDIKKILDDNGLTLVATHLAGNLEDTGQEEKNMIDQTLDILNELETTRIMYSGLRYTSDDQLSRDLDMLNRGAEMCKERSVHLLYHNHHFEFDHDRKVMNALIEKGSDALGFCPDVGWVCKAGADVFAFLEEIKDKMGAIHYKDFKTLEGEKDFCLLGKGITPFKKITDWLRVNMPDAWIIAEQDKPEGTPEQTVRNNADYLKSIV